MAEPHYRVQTKPVADAKSELRRLIGVWLARALRGDGAAPQVGIKGAAGLGKPTQMLLDKRLSDLLDAAEAVVGPMSEFSCPPPRPRIECTLVAADQTRCGRGPVCVSVALPASRIWGGCVAALRDAGLPILPGGSTAPRPRTPDPRVGRASGADVVPRASGLPQAAPEREKAAVGLPGPLKEGNGCERQGAYQSGPEDSAALQEEFAP